jgi:2-polyprenyl-3-methyl-5-hydroxy-6-metoxy-1,4-benzoquinol methylase
MTLPPRRLLDMEETTWWDYWNTAYRSQDDLDAVPTELFQRVASVIAAVTDPKRRSVLEIGCGSGAFSRLLSVSSYHGIDISPAAIELARQKAKQQPLGPANNFKYEVADFHEWPCPSQSFDVVVCIDAVAYFRDQRLAIQKMAEALRPGGKLVLTTINPFIYHRIQRTTSSPLQEGPVSHWLARSELHELVRSAGLSIESSQTIMPRGNRGILRLINSWRLDRAVGRRGAQMLKQLKEKAGLGQYQLVLAACEP